MTEINCVHKIIFKFHIVHPILQISMFHLIYVDCAHIKRLEYKIFIAIM